MEDKHIPAARQPRLTRREVLQGSFLVAAGALLSRFPSLTAGAAPEFQAMLKRIYIAADDHTDYMWRADEATYQQAFLEMIDYYLNLTDATAGNPSDFQSRWNCDGSFWMWVYERNRTASEFERFIGQLRSRHMSIPLNALVSCYGGTPAEAVLRGMYYPGQIERRYNLRFPLAVAMENQTLPYGLGALWAGAGAKYSWRGVCNCATKVPAAGDREHEIYWWQGADGSQVLMKWNSQLTGTSEAMGGYAEARNPADTVEYVDNNTDFRTRYPYNVIGAFGKGWDDLKTLTDEFVTVAKQKTTTNRRVIVSDERDFFEDFEATYGAGLPTIAASFGNEWELYCASMAEVSAQVKRAVEKLRSAEAMATLVSLHQPDFMTSRATARDNAWMALGLYWEHNWTADGPVGRDARAAWQRVIASEITSYVDALYSDAVSALGSLIQTSGTTTRFSVFNPLSWTRNDIADLPYAGTDLVHVVDLSTGSDVPSQIVTVDGERRLRVLATQVPAVGYKVFEIQPGASSTAFSDAASVAGSIIENSFYKITVGSNGAITSLIDKQRANREFARTIDGRTINDLGAGSGTTQVENAGPVSVTLLITATSPLKHTTRITLIRDSDRIDIRNQISQNFSDVRTWSFAFNLDAPDVWHEEVGAVIRARLLSNGGHYSPRNARYDWLTLNHFADMSAGDNSAGVTLSNADCYYMQLGNSTPTTLDTATPRLAPLVGGQVDGPDLGIPNQGGDSQFLQRFALHTHSAFDAAAAMRFALEHQNPLVAATVRGGDAYPEKNYSLLTLSEPNVLLWALKPADDGIDQGMIARVWNMAATPASLVLTSPNTAIARATRVSHIETPIEAAAVAGGALTVSLAPQQLQTFALNFADAAPPSTTTATPATSIATPTDTTPTDTTPTSTLTSTPGCGPYPSPSQLPITPTSTPVTEAAHLHPTEESLNNIPRIFLPLICKLPGLDPLDER